MFIEKPGLETVDAWESLNHTFPNTRFMMVKNNQYRTNVAELYILARRSDTINLNWHNFNRIPNPGSWFTDKRKAWGGVSRDLLPHLLSWVQVLEPEWYDTNTTFYSKTQEYSLDTIKGFYNDAKKAVAGSDVIFSDKVISLNDKVNKKKKIQAFKNFKIDKKLMSYAKKSCIFLHCLPRGDEVSDDVFLGKKSHVWQQALNRVHVQKSILLYCFGKLR